MRLFVESQTKVDPTFVAAILPVLQTRAPTGKRLGPSLTLLLSSPTTPQVIGVIVSEGATIASAGTPATAAATLTIISFEKILEKSKIVMSVKREKARNRAGRADSLIVGWFLMLDPGSGILRQIGV